MNNHWLTQQLKRHTFEMPTTVNEDRELEFTAVKGHMLPKLIEYWRWHLDNGSITRQEHDAIGAIIICVYETAEEELRRHAR